MESKFMPVCLTTLNRADKLKMCLESLAKCRYACDTEIFISVDYPPNERYRGGYEKVIDYLHNEDFHSSFKKIEIIYQKENLGAFKNSQYIVDKALEQFDCYLFVEDDIEFADDALRYYNHFLESYRDDENIMFIAGDNKLMIWGDKIVSSEATDKVTVAPWGAYALAGWKDKFLRLRRLCEEKYFEEETTRPKNVCKLSKQSAFAFYYLMEDIVLRNPNGAYENGCLYATDMLINIYLLLNDKYIILPGYSRVMNNGFDNSGLHCKDDIAMKTYIFNNHTLCAPIENGTRNLDYSLIKQMDNITKARKRIIRTWVKYFLFRILGLEKTMRVIGRFRQK